MLKEIKFLNAPFIPSSNIGDLDYIQGVVDRYNRRTGKNCNLVGIDKNAGVVVVQVLDP